MKSFIAAIVVALLVATGANVILGENQRSVAEAYTASSARL